MSALAAVRRAITATVTYIDATSGAQKGRLDDYFAKRAEILGVIGGAIGDESLGIRPWVVVGPGPQPNTSSLFVLTVPVTTSTGSNELRTIWKIEGTIAPEDESFWATGVPNRVCAVENPFAGNLTTQPGATIFFAGSLDSMLAQSAGAYLCGSAQRVAAVVV